MPILGLEPYVYPEDLLTAPARTLGEPCRWWVLHTRPRAEKSLARKLLQRHVGFFLPLCQRYRKVRGRAVTSYLPLFSGYAFILGDPQARLKALETNLVVNCLEVPDQQQLDSDLARVYQLMLSGAPMTPEERLLPGMPVEIISGPLVGMQGKIIRRGKRLTFLVEVHFLQRGASVEVEGWMIKPLDGYRPPPK